ncbi:methyltransferase domain-containing protein [Thermodesulfobacteriota bacterium]
MKCRHCGSELKLPFVDLGSAPPSNAYLQEENLQAAEKWYPLRVLVCTHCWLVQTEDFAERDELFNADYAYFSSLSSTWLAHAERYVEDMAQRFGLNANSHVVEVAANDGYLLQYVKAHHIPCTGVEPTGSTAKAARAKGIPIEEEFFGVNLAKELVTQGKQADLTTANNVLAHVPDINDFVAGFALLLKPSGVATFEFPHLLKLIEGNQFDTIYHEHFSYLSLISVQRIFETNGLTVFDVEELPTHGGSLRVFAQRCNSGKHACMSRVAKVIEREKHAGMETTEYYTDFQVRAEKVKDDILLFLIDAKRQGKTVAAYGAAAKGNTLLNFAGIRPDLLPYVCDAAPSKQGKYLPGSHIPILAPSALQKYKPDFIIIIPWNIAEEVKQQNANVREWGGRFLVAVPSLCVLT